MCVFGGVRIMCVGMCVVAIRECKLSFLVSLQHVPLRQGPSLNQSRAGGQIDPTIF